MRKKSVKKISAIAGVIITLSLGLQEVCGGSISNTDPDVGLEKSFATGSVSAGGSKAVDGSDTVQKSTYSGSGNITQTVSYKSKKSDGDNKTSDRAVIVDDENAYKENDNRIMIEYREGTKEPKEIKKYAYKEKDVTELIKVYKIKSEKYIKKVIDIAKRCGSDIQAAQPDYKVRIASNSETSSNKVSVKSSGSTKDYYADGSQWALKNNGTFTSPSSEYKDSNITAVEGVDLNAEEAWTAINNASETISKNDDSVVVAVVDTGIDYTNDEIKNVIWKNSDETENGSDSDGNGYTDDTIGWNFTNSGNNPYDDNGHGTAIAGVLAAADDNTGVVGIASDIDIKLMPVKALDSEGESTMSTLIQGIVYADNNGADICNCSWGGESGMADIFNNMIMENVIAQSDMLFVVAAGNESKNIDRLTYTPASYSEDNLITVGSIEWDGSLSWFSNYGTRKVEMCAPGAAIYTTAVGGGYTCEWGTSFSAPYVAGVAALAKAAAGNIDGKGLKELLCNTDNMKLLSNLKYYVTYAGIPDASKVVNAALEYRQTAGATAEPTQTAAPQPSASSSSEVLATETPKVTETPVETTKAPSITAAPEITDGQSGTTATETPQETSTPDVTETPIPDVMQTPTPQITETPTITESPQVTETPEQQSDTVTKTGNIKISSSKSIYKKYKQKLNVQISGNVSAVKYAEGKKAASFFKDDDGSYIYVNSKKFTINASKPGWYTVYVKSTAGNEYTKNIFADVKIVKLSKSKVNINKGAGKKLTAYLQGYKKYAGKLSGKIYFKSCNKKIITVNKTTGKIKAKAKGRAVITAYTKNGKSAKCTVVCR